MPFVFERREVVLRQTFERAAKGLQAGDGFCDDLRVAGVVGGYDFPHGTAVFRDLEGLAFGGPIEEFAEAGFGVEGGDDFQRFQLVADWLNIVGCGL